MKLDKDFQDKFISYLNGLSNEEFRAIIDNPTVNVDFLTCINSSNEESSLLSKSLNFAYSSKQPLQTDSLNTISKITPEKAMKILEDMEYLNKD